MSTADGRSAASTSRQNPASAVKWFAQLRNLWIVGAPWIYFCSQELAYVWTDIDLVARFLCSSIPLRGKGGPDGASSGSGANSGISSSTLVF